METINQSQPVYGIIYKITNLLNFKCYVGQTTQGQEKQEFRKRPLDHIKAAFRGEESSNKEFYRSIRKHGKENFKVEILQECYSQFQLDESEKYYIQHLYNSWWYECGYNVTGGGVSGRIAMKTIGFTGRRHTEKSKAKMSKTLKSANRKTIHSEETRRKLSEANIGKKLTEEHKRKVSDGLRNRSEENKRLTSLKMSYSRKGKNNTVNWHESRLKNTNPRSDNKSGYKGVDYKADKNKYRAVITIAGKKIHLGYFDTAIEASEAYTKKAMEVLMELKKS